MKKDDLWWWWWVWEDCTLSILCYKSILYAESATYYTLPLWSVGLLGIHCMWIYYSLCFLLTFAFLLSYILLHFYFLLVSSFFLSAEANSKCIVVEPHCYTFSTIKYPEKQKLTCLPSKKCN